MSYATGPWGLMNDGPLNRPLWEPWTAYPEAAPGLTVGSTNHTEPVCRVSGYLRDAVANARLIIASPELLAALEFIVNDAEPGEDARLTTEGYNRACAAIAKAIGQPVTA